MEEEKKTLKKFSMSEIANMTTLKPEEMEEAEAEAEALEAEEGYEEEGYEQEDGSSYLPPNMAAEEQKEEKPRMEHYGEQVTVTAVHEFKDMALFMLRHTYANFVGVVGILISIAALVMLILGYGRDSKLTTVLIIIVAGLFLVVSPANLILRAKKQAALSHQDGNAITYTLSDAGVDMFRGEEYASFTWDRLFKVYAGKTGFYVYLASNQAFVLPYACFNGREEVARALFMKHVEGKRNKIRKRESEK